jgi:hypothetical protein
MSTAKDYDDSPPRNGVIFFYTVLTVFVLIGVKFLLDSYFAKTMDAEIHDKVLSRGMEEVSAMRAAEAAELQKTMKLAKGQYTSMGRAGMIAPTSGANKPEVSGWTQLGRKVEAAAAPAPAPEAVAPTPGESPVSPAGRPE